MLLNDLQITVSDILFLCKVQYCLSLSGGTGSYLWGMNQIHFQEAGLKVAFCRAVVFQGIQQKGCALLQKTVLHEHIHNLLRLVKLEKKGLYTHIYHFLCIQIAWLDRHSGVML